MQLYYLTPTIVQMDDPSCIFAALQLLFYLSHPPLPRISIPTKYKHRKLKLKCKYDIKKREKRIKKRKKDAILKNIINGTIVDYQITAKDTS
jgi:hypothetical protein